MRLNGSHVYPAAVETVIAMLRDRVSTIAKYESMGNRDVEIVELVSGDTGLRIVSSRVVDVELPGFAKKALKPTNTMVQTDEWHRRNDGSWAGTFDIDVHGSPAHISGTMTLSLDGTGSRHDVTVDVDVKVPLVGGKIADWIGKNDVRRTLDAEYAFNDSRLAPA
jgi:hypothetical protein